MKKRGKKFTLLELLIVVAVIGILSSLLLPSLQHSRTAAFSSVSISNMKQIGQAFMIYSADNDGTFPPSRYPTGNRAAWPDHVENILNLDETNKLLVHPGVGFPPAVTRTYAITQAGMGLDADGNFTNRLARKVTSIEHPSLTHLLTESKLQNSSTGKWRITWVQVFNDISAVSPEATTYLHFPYDNKHHLMNADISVITRKFSQRSQILQTHWTGLGY